MITLGRVFDTTSPHNIGVLMETLSQHRAAFSRLQLGARVATRTGAGTQAFSEFMADVVVPHQGDFRRIDAMVERHRRTYLDVYRALRSKVIAHRVITDTAKLDALWKKTRFRDLEKMVLFLNQLHLAITETYWNGRRLSIRPARYAIGRILKTPRGKRAVVGIHEDVAKHTRRVLESLAPPKPEPETWRRRIAKA